MTEVIPAGSLQYVKVPIAPKVSGAIVDPTADVVTMAFMASGSAPSSGDLKTASWETVSTDVHYPYRARCLVGPGGTVTLTAGLYTVWVKVVDNPETVLRPAGLLRVI